MTYGLIAEILHRGGPRQVGRVLALSEPFFDDGTPVPRWRMVNAAGLPPAHQRDTALRLLEEENCPLSTDGTRVQLRHAEWFPDIEPAHPGAL